MPWAEILGGATGGVATIIVLGVLFGQKIFDALLTAAIKRSEEVRQLLSNVDLDLRRARATPYQELWHLTRCLPLWPKAANASCADMRIFSGELRDWYFTGGGLWLSRESRKAYEALQTRLQDFQGRDGPLDGPLNEYEEIRVLCSQLRSELTRDLSSRRSPNPELAGVTQPTA
jgi:hypothetical protein